MGLLKNILSSLVSVIKTKLNDVNGKAEKGVIAYNNSIREKSLPYGGGTALTLDTASNEVGFAYVDGSAGSQADNGSFISFGGFGGSYQTQIHARYNGNGDVISFRTQNSDTGNFNPFYALWHTGNFNPALTAIDTNVLHKTGEETKNDKLILSKVVNGAFVALLLQNLSDNAGEQSVAIDFGGFYKHGKIYSYGSPQQHSGGGIRIQSVKSGTADTLNNGVTVDRNGFVGINKLNPTATLDIEGNGLFSGGVIATQFVANFGGILIRSTGGVNAGTTKICFENLQATIGWAISQGVEGATQEGLHFGTWDGGSYGNKVSIVNDGDILTTIYGSASQWNTAYLKRVVATSITGDSNKTFTITQADGTILTASFNDKDTEYPDDVINTLTFNVNSDGVLIVITSEGAVLSVSFDGRYSLLGHIHLISDIIGLQAALDSKEPTIIKKTGFNNDFGSTAGTVAQGNDQRIINGQTAFDWGDFRDFGLGTDFKYAPSNDLNNIAVSGNYSIKADTLNRPFSCGNVIHSGNTIGFTQIAIDTTTGYIWTRIKTEFLTEPTPWVFVFDNNNFNPDLKANASSVYTKAEALDVFVNLNGVQTINNTKTFTSSPIVPTPALGIHAVNKLYTEGRYVIKKTVDWTDIPHNLPANFINVVLRYKISNGNYTLDFSWEAVSGGDYDMDLGAIIATIPNIDPECLHTIFLKEFTNTVDGRSIVGLKLISTGGIVNLASASVSNGYAESGKTRITLPIAG